MTKKAVIFTGGKQYLVSEDDTLDIELLKTDKKTTSFEPLLVIDDKKTSVGKPSVTGASVTAAIVEQDTKDPKVTSIRYKAKKRVHKVRGHRQHKTTIKISSIKTK